MLLSLTNLQEEQLELSRKLSDRRRASLRPLLPYNAAQSDNPHILVSEASVSNFTDLLDGTGTIRRASTQSVGAVIVAVSTHKLLGLYE